MNLRNLAIWGAILVAIVLIYSVMQSQTHSAAAPQDMVYSDLLARIDNGEIAKAPVTGSTIDVTDKQNHDFRIVGPGDFDPALVDPMKAHQLKFQFGHP